jgi:DNA-binding NarL/FixJ family response regulator
MGVVKRNRFDVVIADSYPCFVEGVQDWLGDFEWVGTVISSNDWNEVKAQFEGNECGMLITTVKWISENPGIAPILDHCMRNNIKIVVFADKNSPRQISELYANGVDCLISLVDTKDEFLWGLNQVADDKSHLSSDLLMALLHSRISPPSSKSIFNKLSAREAEILQLIRKGFTNKEIAAKLFISKRTVDGYRESILGKFGARNTAQLISMTADPGHPG